jgi:hypothetical protein
LNTLLFALFEFTQKPQKMVYGVKLLLKQECDMAHDFPNGQKHMTED